ncbi:hypothetical protein PHET_04736 [Paragonimus heterotremus]|uniref:Intraflagellar transport protein 27 n=1 Tax=Paragonimus heterotremus TaxID=100268 RepID=A0A8J4TIF8_9TREM|nr:hypothetical protein PHET_04736 [Paragonimus heterotremus]
MHNTIRGKCVLLATTGKSALVQMFVSDGREFPRNYCMSVSAELVLKNILIPDAQDTVVWFKTTFFQFLLGIVHLYSSWQRPVLIGNKTDLEARRIITSDDGEHLAKSFGIPFYETSAKEAVGIETPFLYLAKEYHNLYLKKIENFQTMI